VIAPIQQMTKAEILRLANNRCEAHSHTYLEHYNCYLKENPDTKKIGFYDIECSNLDADFGIILTYAIKVLGKDEYYTGRIKKVDIERAQAGDEDKVVVRQLVEDLQKFDLLIGYYSSRFDMPFIRTRALTCGIDFPEYGSVKHIDLYFTVRGKFKLSSNRLENACRVILGKTEKTRVDGKFWRAATRGDNKSLDYIAQHNRFDVDDLEKLYNKVIGFRRKNDASI
jgi:uncharacterized protein YprB with RNaseH-like and TPR domain